MPDEIQTTTELLHAPFEDIEFAEVKLKKRPEGHQVRGRIIGRFGNSDLVLLFRGDRNKVSQASEWDILRYQPVTSGIEKAMIEDGMENL